MEVNSDEMGVSNEFTDILIKSTNEAEFNEIKDRFNDILSATDARVLTRKGVKRITSSCKFWQLKLNTICLVDSLNKNKLFNYIMNGVGKDEMYDECYIIQTILSKINDINQDFGLYDIVYLNRPNRIQLMTIINEASISKLLVDDEYKYGKNIVLSLCIYQTDAYSFQKPQQIGLIQHFFTLIITPEGKYYINSSYGSDYVCISQYTTEITSDAFFDICSKFQDIKTNMDAIQTFFNTYFFRKIHAHQLREVTADREDWTSNEIRRQTIYRPIEQGIQAEIDFYPQVSNSFTIAVIKGYKSILKNLIPLSYETTKRKPSSTSKQTKRRRPSPSEEEEESSVGGRKLIKRTKKRIHKHKTKRLRPVHRRRRNTNKHRIIKRK